MPDLSRIVLGAALVGMRMLRGLMWLLAVAALSCVVAAAWAKTGPVVSLGDSNARRLTAFAMPAETGIRLLRPPGRLHVFDYDHHRGV